MILPFSKIKTLNYDFFFLKTSLQLQFRKWLPSLLLLIFFFKSNGSLLYVTLLQL